MNARIQEKENTMKIPVDEASVTQGCAKKIGVYCRSATGRQSIVRQRKMAEHYCKHNNLRIDYLYIDEGVSGLTPFKLRPAGVQILQDIQHGTLNTLLICSLDRISRNVRTFEVLTHLQKSGVEITIIQQPAGNLAESNSSSVWLPERGSFLERVMNFYSGNGRFRSYRSQCAV